MPYSPRKAAQTVAYFAMQNGGNKIFVLMALKLVYLADRESLKQRGHPIQQEARVSMQHGPVNSNTYGFLSGSYDGSDVGWSDFLTDKAHHYVGLRSPNLTVDDLDELSERELNILAFVWGEFGHMDRFELVKWTHNPVNVPEWEDPNGSSVTIPMDKMMAGVGLDRSIERARELESLEQASSILASL